MILILPWLTLPPPSQDDDKPMIDIMDQLSPAILESFASVAVSDAVSRGFFFYCKQHLQSSVWIVEQEVA